MERTLSFNFEYEENDNEQPYACPNVICVVPNPNTVSDAELVLTANTCVQALATKHGLEQALTMINDAAVGKLRNGSRFDTHWFNSLEDSVFP